jgi:hypothetical protein
MRGLWIAIVVLGCNSSKKDTPEVSPVPARQPQDAAAVAAPAPTTACADRTAHLDKRLHELATATPGFMPLAHDIAAPDAAAGKPFDTRGFVIGIARDGKTSTQGQVFATLKDLGDYLDAMNKQALEKFIMAGGSSHDAHFPVYLWVDKDTPAGAVADVLATAAAAGDHWSMRLLVASKTAPPPEPAPPAEVKAIADKLPATEPDATKYLVQQLRDAIGACKPIIVTLGTASLEGLPQKEADKLAKDVPAGLASCECKLPNPDVFEWGMHVWFGTLAPPLAWVDMPKVAKHDKQPISKLVK